MPNQEIVAHLPIDESPAGWVLDPVLRDDAVDAAFVDWDAPLVAAGYWGMLGLIRVVELPETHGVKALHFDLDYTDPQRGRRPNWGTRYDRALVTHEPVPADVTIQASLAISSTVTSALSDNNVLVRPWLGLMGRVRTVRHYYFFCLEYPDAAVLYRRQDNTWVELARHPMHIKIHVPYDLRLDMRGDCLTGYVDGERVCRVTDYAYSNGKAGVRATCPSYVFSCNVAATARSVGQHMLRLRNQDDEIHAIQAELPKPVLERTIELRSLGKVGNVTFGPYAGPAKPQQMLVTIPYADDEVRPDQLTHLLRTLDGETIWQADIPMFRYIPTAPRDDGHCDIFGMSHEELFLVDGRNGAILARAPLPTLPDWPGLFWAFMPRSPVDLAGRGAQREFLIREGGDDCQNIWAVSEGLEILWHQRVPVKIGHDWSVGACDINGDGREEVLIGGTLLSADGEIVWAQTELNELLAIPYGGHVDALALGFFGEPDDRPVAHLQSSSAGNVVLDALTGEIVAVHPQGHTQGRQVGHFVPGEPGLQVQVGCRWGNYGLLSYYSWDGRRLFSFQPDYIGQSGPALNWAGDGYELSVVATDPRRAAAYDYLGRPILDLRPFLPEGEGLYHNGFLYAQDILGDPRDEIIMGHGGVIHIITQEHPLVAGSRVYAPTRRWSISLPGWTTA